MENKKLWYAVQKDSTDEWGNGSFDREEAVKMLKKQGYGLIAIIDEETQTCVEEIEFKSVELSAEDAEYLAINDETWSQKFIAWLAENDKQPEEWDYEDLGNFFRENGCTTEQ